MSVTRQSNYFVWICEGAGLIGMASTLVLCSLAYSGQADTSFWIAVAASLVGNMVYVTHVLMQRATGGNALTWREMILANIVPVVAIGVTVVLIGETAGLFNLSPDQPPAPNRHVITISPKSHTS